MKKRPILRTKAAVIADDLTGALDTGIKFQALGIETEVILSINLKSLSLSSQVAVIDTETRHASAAEAYAAVRRAVEHCRDLGIRYFYKKTDSAMRGHIGSELSAMADALGQEVVFVPALPQENRTTRNGIQYIDGIPVGESIFREDPLNPVTESAIWRIVRQESAIDVRMVDESGRAWRAEEDPARQRPNAQTRRAGVAVYDAADDEAMARIAGELKAKAGVVAVAGCAGFARYFAEGLPCRKTAGRPYKRAQHLVVVSGSLNAVTERQILHAAKNGACRVCLNAQQKFQSDYLETPAGRRWLARVQAAAASRRVTVLDVCLPADERRAVRGNPVCSEASEKLVRRLSAIVQALVRQAKDTAFMVVGGDTLFALIDGLNADHIQPICEIVQGTPLFQLMAEDETLQIISKSGGFGAEDLIERVASVMLATEKG
jgi:uncharacterized protein YgbK (DUF1537 family)